MHSFVPGGRLSGGQSEPLASQHGADPEPNVGDSSSISLNSRTEQPYDPVRSTSSTVFGPDAVPLGSESSRGRADHTRYPDAGRRRGSQSAIRRRSLSSHLPRTMDFVDRAEKTDHKAQAPGSSAKLGTFSGVWVPTTLNGLSILMFLRFGFILGQSGVFGMMGMFAGSYLINTVTTMSISAIASNGTVRGGGAYYLISRSLGPEFGGSIGLILYLTFILSTGMNAVGLINVVRDNFGAASGTIANFLPEGFWWDYLWATIILAICTGICLGGSSIFARASTSLLAVLSVSMFSVPLSAAVKSPFTNSRLGIHFTGLSWETFVSNLKPRLTEGAAGSQNSGKETFQSLFGILFPATGAIFAGASMSGDLKNPSRSIPSGTFGSIGFTFAAYSLVMLAMAASVTRESLYNDVNIMQHTNLHEVIVILGEFATSFFSTLMGLVGAAKLLQAVARDTIIPGISIFSRGTKKSGNPVIAILFTFVVGQITMLLNVNQIAMVSAMFYLMTFLVTNLACFLLKVGSAPNFRPSFYYFSSWTAFAGTIASAGSMFFIDARYATGCVCVLVIMFLIIHYTTPPKSWGDVSQSLIYHQVRKYLLRLKPEHVKFWRPQILLFVNDFESQYKMISFCNSLKKGALFVLGRVIVTQDFASMVPEVRKEQAAWSKFIEYSKVKAFINVALAPTAEWGIRNVVLNSGLGGMRPNIVVIGQYRKDQIDHLTTELAHKTQGLRVPQAGEQAGESVGSGSTESEQTMTVQSYLNILEDLLFRLRINVAVARGFEQLEIPGTNGRNAKSRIDLWPIQMSAEVSTGRPRDTQNLLTTNFDTYTLILQLGCILHTVPSWKKYYRVRVAVFVEYESDVKEERGRVETLLEKLRMEAEVLVFWLASGDLQSYRIIVNGEQSGIEEEDLKRVDTVLKDEDWWHEMKSFRQGMRRPRAKHPQVARLLETTPAWRNPSFQHGQRKDDDTRFDRLRDIVESSKRRRSIGARSVSFGMQTHRLLDSMVVDDSDDSDDSSSQESDTEPYAGESEGEGEISDAASRPTGESGEASESRRQGRESRSSGPVRKLQKKKKQGPQAASEEAVTDGSDSSGEDAPPPGPPVPEITRTPVSDEEHAINKGNQPLRRIESSARFTSSPIPETKVADEEGTGPSIMFAETDPQQASWRSPPRESIYSRVSQQASSAPGNGVPASGYPSQASVPLSFNDLPCRAQHLVLNELIKKNSDKTAVMFTTLPSPIEGTYQDKDASEAFVSDLEVLCDGLPPCLLVHSNSMTVTMNL